MFDLLKSQEYNLLAICRNRNFKEPENVRSARPKNLNLFTIRFPLTAITSIMHRVSGFVLFLLIPVALWVLQLSLDSLGFDRLQGFMSSIPAKLIIWLLLAPFCYHLVAGIRHLLSDLHFGNTRAGGKRASIVTLIVSFVLFILVGIWLW